MSLHTYAERWLEHAKTRVRPRTFEGYAHRLRTHVLPVIGAVELTKLRPAHVEQVMDDMAARGLSASTIRDARMILGNALRQAVAWGLINSNPVQAIRPPKAEPPQLHIPNPEQVAALVEVASGTVWDVPLLLAAVTGARRGEVLAVAWSEVDLESGRLRIVRSLQATPGAAVPAPQVQAGATRDHASPLRR